MGGLRKAASTPKDSTVRSRDEQIKAILSWNVFRWATGRLRDGETMDTVRFRDLIDVTEDDVYEFVLVNGFDERAVIERGSADNHRCIVPEADDRWSVDYTERGKKSEEVVVSSIADARREVVHRLMVSARISLNHRFKHAHPEMSLPKPSEMA